MSTNIKITIAESSSIIRCGLETLLKRLPGFRIQISEITAADCLTEGLRIYKPDILIMNPSIPGNCNLQHLKDECGCPDMKCFALFSPAAVPASPLRRADIRIRQCRRVEAQAGTPQHRRSAARRRGKR